MKHVAGIGIGICLGIFAAAMLSGCSPTLHPAITAQLQGLPGGYGLLISGSGFSPTNPCASVVVVNYPQSGTIDPVNTKMPCNIGGSTASFRNYSWLVPLAPCPSANVSTISAVVLGIDLQTIDPAQAQVSLPCSAPVLCPTSLKGSQLPTANWSPGSTVPSYYANQSAILNSGNGSPITTQPSLGVIQTALGGLTAFTRQRSTCRTGRMVLVPAAVFRAGSSHAAMIRQSLPI